MRIKNIRKHAMGLKEIIVRSPFANRMLRINIIIALPRAFKKVAFSSLENRAPTQMEMKTQKNKGTKD
jgi:hypothetical protein